MTPAPSAMVMRQFVGPRTDEIPEGGRVIVELGGKELGIFRIDGEFFALLNHCPHLGGPLCAGEMIGTITSTGPGELEYDAGKRMITCPYHGWEFDIRTGQSYWSPATSRARRLPVRVASGRTILGDEPGAASAAPRGREAGPYVAQTLPVSVESDYVVVTIRLPVAADTTREEQE